MLNKIFYIFLLISVSLSGCSNFDKEQYVIKDRQESVKLLNNVLANTKDDYLSLNCIVEKDYKIQSILYEDNNFISRHLSIRKKEQLETVMELVENFKWNPADVPNKIILTEKELKIFKDEADSDFPSYQKLSLCPEGYLKISKPIFNKSFSKAIVHIGQACGFMCDNGEFRLYKLKNGYWELEEIISIYTS